MQCRTMFCSSSPTLVINVDRRLSEPYDLTKCWYSAVEGHKQSTCIFLYSKGPLSIYGKYGTRNPLMSWSHL